MVRCRHGCGIHDRQPTDAGYRLGG